MHEVRGSSPLPPTTVPTGDITGAAQVRGADQLQSQSDRAGHARRDDPREPPPRVAWLKATAIQPGGGTTRERPVEPVRDPPVRAEQSAHAVGQPEPVRRRVEPREKPLVLSDGRFRAVSERTTAAAGRQQQDRRLDRRTSVAAAGGDRDERRARRPRPGRGTDRGGRGARGAVRRRGARLRRGVARRRAPTAISTRCATRPPTSWPRPSWASSRTPARHRPAIDDGFYYDFLLPRPLTPDDLAAIEDGHARIDRRGPRVRAQGVRVAEGRAFFERREPAVQGRDPRRPRDALQGGG